MATHALGITAFLGPLGTPEAWIPVAVDAGVQALEVRAEPGFAHPHTMTTRERKRLRQLLCEAGLTVSLHAPLYDINPASPNPEAEVLAWSELSACVGLAEHLGAGVLVVHPGAVPAEHPPRYREQAWRRFVLGLETLGAYAHSRGVHVALENKQRGKGEDLVATPEEHLLALHEAPSVGACLDLGHSHTLGIDAAAYVEALGPRLIHVHLHDNQGALDEHLPLGEGTLDWKRALAALEQSDYAGVVVLELADVVGIQRTLARIRGQTERDEG